MSPEGTMPTPRALGYRMPAEWETQAATWLIWPWRRDLWRGSYAEVVTAFARIAAELSPDQRVEIPVASDAMAGEARAAILRVGGVADQLSFRLIATDDSWMRDCGPSFVIRDAPIEENNTQGSDASISGQPVPTLAAVGWRFNAWGGKFPPWENDAAVAATVARMLGVPLFQPGIVMEGGSFEVNGQGTLLTTRQCLLHRNRNPELSREQLEAILGEFLNVRRVIWLNRGLEGDDTDGHVDDLTRFVGPATVVTTLTHDRADVNYEPLQENLAILRQATTAAGQPLAIIPLPLPEARYHAGERLPASYANFYIGNRKVLVPVFEVPEDEVALRTLQRVFPDRQVVGIAAQALLLGSGAIHCVTQQQPRAANNS